jgi:recombination protein RecT
MGNPNRGQNNAPRQMQRQEPRINYEEAAKDVLSGLEYYRGQLEPVLPSGTTWSRFHATIATLLNHNPAILKCTVPSIIRGCMKAAYDGLALDGREAALVPSNNTYGKGDNAVTKKEARYNPMVAGLRKQILQSGLVDAVEVILVYDGEPYRVMRGTSKNVEHEEIIACRGPTKKIIAVYAVAELKNGRQIVETMTASEVEAIRKIAQTDNVWKTHTGEMYRKTCLRRIRKQLPGIGDVRDAEMILLFPEMSRNQQPALPAPPKPQRADFEPQAQLGQPSNTLEELNRFDQTADELFVNQDEGAGGLAPAETRQKSPAKKAAKSAEKQDPNPKVDEGHGQPADSSPPEEHHDNQAPVMPATDDAWDEWADQWRTAIPEIKNLDALNEEFQKQGPLIAAAPKHLGDAINEAFTDQLAELSAGDSSGGTGTSQGSLNIPDGEKQ